MNLLAIPFVQTVGLTEDQNGRLTLPFQTTVHNHLQTMHASAQFTLAETASGQLLLTLFPELEGKVLPVLRSSEVKFKKPATQELFAHATVSDEARLRFHKQLETKKRANITVDVSLEDKDGTVTCTGSFDWFVQAL